MTGLVTPVINMGFITVEKDDIWITLLLDMWQSVSFKQYSFINVLMDSSQLTIMLHVVWCHLVGECAFTKEKKHFATWISYHNYYEREK